MEEETGEMAGGGQKTRTGPRPDEDEEVERLTGEGVDEGGGGQEDAGEIGRMAGEKGDSLGGCCGCGG